MKAVIDADSLCYAAGHASHIKEAEFAFNGYIKRIINDTQCDEFIGYVEAINGKNIFRNHIAFTKPYKSNRANRQSPAFKNEMKLYAKSAYGMKFCHTHESEDAATITANDIGLDKCIKCCCDKDMLTAPGTFYNYFGTEWKLPYYDRVDDKIITVSAEQAERNLYTQICQGDGDDAIRGVPGCGPAGARNVVEGVSVEELPFAVGKLYKDEGLSYAELLETARLVYILRSRTDVFTPLTREQWEAL